MPPNGCKAASSSAHVLSNEPPATVHHASGLGAWNTPAPLALSETSSQTFGFMRKDSKSRYARLAVEAVTTTLGPMPVDQFLDVFLSRQQISQEGIPAAARAFEGIRKLEKEVDFYAPLIEAINEDHSAVNARASRCPGFVFRKTCNSADQQRGKVGAMKSDIVGFAARHLSLMDADSNDPDSMTDMGFAAVYIEVKPKQTMDHYRDPGREDKREEWRFALPNYSGDTEGSNLDKEKQDFGQNVAYAAEICARQHRHCCFSISLSGSSARLIRWDRAGSVVTESFDILAEPHFLCDFLWCFACVSDPERGYDLTVKRAARSEELLFSERIEAHVKTQMMPTPDPAAISTDLDDQALADMSIHYLRRSVTAIEITHPMVPDGQPPTHSRRLLVSRPTSAPLSMAGRGTRSYWAVDVSTEQVVFLKDTWRIDIPGNSSNLYKQEGVVLDGLHRHGVRHIPPVLCHGDVKVVVEDEAGELQTRSDKFQTTLTQNFLDEPWVCSHALLRLRSRVVKRTHYRLTLGVVGFDLLNLRGTAELLHGTYSAFQASIDAYKLARCLHRDLSPANIILHRRLNSDGTPQQGMRDAYLVDWDLSCNVGHEYSGEQYVPSMWWQFASANIASGSKHRHNIRDDMESLFYVVLYCGLLRLPHNLTPTPLRMTLNSLFDYYQMILGDEGLCIDGGSGKAKNKANRTYTATLSWECAGMASWMDTMLDFIGPIVSTPPSRRDKWHPDDVDKYWSGFLSSTELPLADRVNNILQSPSKFGGIRPPKALELAEPPTMASSSKRTFEDPFDSEDPPPRKIARKGGRTFITRVPTQHVFAEGSRHAPPSGPRAATSRAQSAASQAPSVVSYATAPPPSPTPGPSLINMENGTPAADLKPVLSNTESYGMETLGDAKGKGRVVVATSERTPDANAGQSLGHGTAGNKRKRGDGGDKGTSNSGGHSAGRLRADPHSITVRGICKKAYVDAHPNATLDDFNVYFAGLDRKTLAVYEELSEKKKADRRDQKAIEKRLKNRPNRVR
ncbi:hypothetical protein BD413DRAFT_651640 [Trametes elegans]|nr:hypothetical protein BD413DRAFT_651640 [Trametes elegans]